MLDRTPAISRCSDIGFGYHEPSMMSRPRTPFVLLTGLATLLLVGCNPENAPPHPDREPGQRLPLTSPCDALDEFRCLLPWPSSTFTTVDSSTATGLRLAVEASSLFVEDDPSALNRADGFSRISPLMTGFDAELGDPDEAVRLIVAQHDHPRYGETEPLRLRVVEEAGPESLLVAYPLRPLEANADYVAVVLDELTTADDQRLSPSRPNLLALGLAEPATDEEAQLSAYHAPTRAALEAAGIDAHEVLVIWDFTTRSADDSTTWLEQMIESSRASVLADDTAFVIDEVELHDEPPIAAVVEGRITDVPSYHDDDGLVLDDAGAPQIVGSSEAFFRVVIPAGDDHYPCVMYGHGTGGSYHDASFDEELAAVGIGKVGIQLHGWTESELPETWLSLEQMQAGTHRSTSRLLQALADGAAIQQALEGPLGDALSAATILDSPNPAAGRRPNLDTPIWTGGSLGGVMGFVYAGAHPDLRYAVLNVPGAAWTHWIPDSVNWAMLTLFFEIPYGGQINLLHAMSVSQINWDPIDGASWTDVWAEKDAMLLIQESMGDRVLPNAGTEMVAQSSNALLVGPVLEPIAGLDSADATAEGSGITQFRVPTDDGDLAVHGFGARDTPAGAAAREQITNYIDSILAGEPRIEVPLGCTDVTPDGSCDFSEY